MDIISLIHYVSSNSNDTILYALLGIFFIAPAVLSIIALIIVLIIYIPFKKYREFVLNHSIAIKNLTKLNSKYKFGHAPWKEYTKAYDNQDFYNEISTLDYLIYQLQYDQKEIKASIQKALNNKTLYADYMKDVKQINKLGEYDAPIEKLNREKLIKVENKQFDRLIKTPDIDFKVKVVLVLTKINDAYVTSKTHSYSPEEISEIIKRLNQKRGNYFVNKEIWDAICRVERGKVTNKLRFYIYNRDHNRCRYCGSTRNLEVDHIIPISKGGKSTPDNLQTLCHKCNVKKGTDIY